MQHAAAGSPSVSSLHSKRYDLRGIPAPYIDSSLFISPLRCLIFNVVIFNHFLMCPVHGKGCESKAQLFAASSHIDCYFAALVQHCNIQWSSLAVYASGLAWQRDRPLRWHCIEWANRGEGGCCERNVVNRARRKAIPLIYLKQTKSWDLHILSFCCCRVTIEIMQNSVWKNLEKIFLPWLVSKNVKVLRKTFYVRFKSARCDFKGKDT